MKGIWVDLQDGEFNTLELARKKGTLCFSRPAGGARQRI